MTIQNMTVGVKREGNGIVSHDCRYRFSIHIIFQGSCTERVTECMEGEASDTTHIQNLVVEIFEGSWLNVTTKGICDNKSSILISCSCNRFVGELNISPLL